jgi:hypothetical protein
MTYPMMQHIPLRSAYLCQDCNCIGNCSMQCPACASTAVLNLSSVLDREEAMGEQLEPTLSFPRPVIAVRGDLESMVA